MNEPKSPQSEADDDRERARKHGFVMDDAPIEEAMDGLAEDVPTEESPSDDEHEHEHEHEHEQE